MFETEVTSYESKKEAQTSSDLPPDNNFNTKKKPLQTWDAEIWATQKPSECRPSIARLGQLCRSLRTRMCPFVSSNCCMSVCSLDDNPDQFFWMHRTQKLQISCILTSPVHSLSINTTVFSIPSRDSLSDVQKWWWWRWYKRGCDEWWPIILRVQLVRIRPRTRFLSHKNSRLLPQCHVIHDIRCELLVHHWLFMSFSDSIGNVRFSPFIFKNPIKDFKLIHDPLSVCNALEVVRETVISFGLNTRSIESVRRCPESRKWSSKIITHELSQTSYLLKSCPTSLTSTDHPSDSAFSRAHPHSISNLTLVIAPCHNDPALCTIHAESVWLPMTKKVGTPICSSWYCILSWQSAKSSTLPKDRNRVKKTLRWVTPSRNHPPFCMEACSAWFSCWVRLATERSSVMMGRTNEAPLKVSQIKVLAFTQFGRTTRLDTAEVQMEQLTPSQSSARVVKTPHHVADRHIPEHKRSRAVQTRGARMRPSFSLSRAGTTNLPSRAHTWLLRALVSYGTIYPPPLVCPLWPCGFFAMEGAHTPLNSHMKQTRASATRWKHEYVQKWSTDYVMHHSLIQKRRDVRWDVCSWKLTKMEDKRLRDLMNMKIREGCCPRTCKVRCANTRTWWRRNSAKDTEEAWWRNKSCVSKGKLEAIPNRTRQNGTVDQTRFVTAVCGSGKGLDWFSCQWGACANEIWWGQTCARERRYCWCDSVEGSPYYRKSTETKRQTEKSTELRQERRKERTVISCKLKANDLLVRPKKRKNRVEKDAGEQFVGFAISLRDCTHRQFILSFFLSRGLQWKKKQYDGWCELDASGKPKSQNNGSWISGEEQLETVL